MASMSLPAILTNLGLPDLGQVGFLTYLRPWGTKDLRQLEIHPMGKINKSLLAGWPDCEKSGWKEKLSTQSSPGIPHLGLAGRASIQPKINPTGNFTDF